MCYGYQGHKEKTNFNLLPPPTHYTIIPPILVTHLTMDHKHKSYHKHKLRLLTARHVMATLAANYIISGERIGHL